MISNAGTPVNQVGAQVGRQGVPLEGGVLSHPDLFQLVFVLVSTSLQVSASGSSPET